MRAPIANRPRRMTGFTLIEIMVVVVIIGLLAAIVAPNVVSRLDDAAIVRAKQDIRTIETAINSYRIDNFRYPTEDEGLEILVGIGQGLDRNNAEKYLPRLPVDPWDNDYMYANPGQHGEFDVYTYGADGEEGGEDINADIGNWNLDD